MAIIQTIPLGKKYGSMTSSEAQAGTNTESQLISAKVLNDQIDEKISDIGLATVATSGSYNDLNDKPAIPTIPTVNNGTLTIQKNGTTVKTFSANASANTTANITVPTKTSDLTNDSDYATRANVADSLQEAKNYTGSAVANCVNLTGTQTITGAKSIDSDYINLIDSTWDYTDTTNASHARTYRISDKTGMLLGGLQLTQDTSNNRYLSLLIKDGNGANSYVNISSGKAMYPSEDNTFSLGFSHRRWANVYATTFYGNLSGNATTATKATQDASGNVITTTYATKAENSLKANDSAVVHTSGNETISGTKNFTSNVINKITTYAVTDTPTSDIYRQYFFHDKNDNSLGLLQYASRPTGVRDLSLYVNGKDRSLHGIQINTNKEVIPIGNNSYSLGSSKAYWNSCYATNVNTSYITTNSNTPLRMIYGSYGAFWRHDGTNLYLMLTNKNDQYGAWNSFRPIQVNLSTGICNINGNAATATKATQDASGNVITNTYVTKTALSSGTNNGGASTGVGSLILGCVSGNDMASAESAAHSNTFLNISGSVIKLASLSMVSSADVFAINKDSTTLPGTWRFLGYSKQPSNSLYTLGLFIRIA